MKTFLLFYYSTKLSASFTRLLYSSSSFSMSSLLSPGACDNYFKMGSKTRRHSVIGCIGYEHANPCVSVIDSIVEKVDVGVGCGIGCDDSGHDNNNTCAICLESLVLYAGIDGASQKNVATTECGHTFCLSCLLTNLRVSNLCPLCRTPVEKNVKQVLKPLSYSEGIGLLNHELNGLRIYEDVEQYVQNALEISTQPNTNGQNVQDVIDSIVNMVTNFGFNLLYDATLHTNGGEEQHMDQEWIVQMYNNDDSDDSTINDYNNSDDSDDSEEEDEEEEEEDEEEEEEEEDDEEKKESKYQVVLPEVPESMLE